jgi:hypothetical protein
MRVKLIWIVWLAGWLVSASFAAEPAVNLGEQPCAALTNATILIIRHAEKPRTGTDLAPDGNLRAAAYVGYFKNLQLDGRPVTPDHLFCTADSNGSHRPRLTLEPLGQALKLPLDNRYQNKDTAALGQELRARPHGRNLLICWHHGEIPVLLRSLGAAPEAVLPHGQWPDTVFGWMLELHYDAAGRLQTTRCIHENLMPDDQAAPAK